MTTIDLTKLANLRSLARGAHYGRSSDRCVMEAIAEITGEELSDRPSCVSCGLAGSGQLINDALSDEHRQRLIGYIPVLIGTADDGREKDRAQVAVNFADRLITAGVVASRDRLYWHEWLSQGRHLQVPSIAISNSAHVAISAGDPALMFDFLDAMLGVNAPPAEPDAVATEATLVEVGG